MMLRWQREQSTWVEKGCRNCITSASMSERIEKSTSSIRCSSVEKSLSLPDRRSWKSPATAPSVFSTLTATESRLLATPTSSNLIAERNESHLEVMNVRSSCPARKDAIDKRIL